MKKILCCLFLLSFTATQAQWDELLVPYRVGNKWGYSDTTGKLYIPAVYDRVEMLNYTYYEIVAPMYAVVGLGEKTIVINQKRKEIFSGLFKSITVVYLKYSPFFIVTDRKGKTGVRSVKGQLIPTIYDDVNVIGDSVFLARKANGEIVYNTSGKIISQKIKKDDEDLTGVVMMKHDGSTSFPDPSFVPVKDRREDFENIYAGRSADRIERIDSITHNGSATLLTKGSRQVILYPGYYEVGKEFSRDLKIRQVVICNNGTLDRSRYDTRAFLIVDSAGKAGVMTDGGNYIVPLEYNNITYRSMWRILDLEKHNKHGTFILNTVYPAILPAYDSILEKHSLLVSSKWNYGLFKVKKNGKEMFVGENGVEFYSPK